MALAIWGACVLLGGCAGVPQVRLDVAPDPRYGAFLEGSGHINPEYPALPNGGGD